MSTKKNAVLKFGLSLTCWHDEKKKDFWIRHFFNKVWNYLDACNWLISKWNSKFQITVHQSSSFLFLEGYTAGRVFVSDCSKLQGANLSNIFCCNSEHLLANYRNYTWNFSFSDQCLLWIIIIMSSLQSSVNNCWSNNRIAK